MVCGGPGLMRALWLLMAIALLPAEALADDAASGASEHLKAVDLAATATSTHGWKRRVSVGFNGALAQSSDLPESERVRGAALAERLSLGDPAETAAIDTLQRTGFSPDQALAYLNRLVDQQAFTRAADDIFLASAALFIILIAFVWLTKRPPRVGAPVDAGGAH